MAHGGRDSMPVTSSRTIARLRALTAALLAASVATTWGACRDLVAGDATNLMDDLCSTLDACYGGDASVPDCNTTLRERFAAGTESEVDQFVRFVGGHECFDTCPHALGCTDQAPLCVGNDAACVGRSDCCDWSLGTLDCVGGACCLGQGQPCVEDASGCCQDDCRNGFCGGRECVAVDQPCASSFDCCTQRCVSGTCEALSECARVDEACNSDLDCCADTSAGPEATGALLCDLTTHRCAAPTEACVLGSPCEAGMADCCGDGLRCYLSPAGGVCGAIECAPLDVDCELDSDCCLPAICKYDPAPHCETVNDGDCVKTGAACTEGGDCCSNACSNSANATAPGVCLEYAGSPCGTDFACHDPCSLGEPMGATSCTGDATLGGRAACIASVVQLDPFCGCTAWDSLCLEEAALQCQCP